MPPIYLEALDKHTENDSLREGRQNGAAAEGAIPETLECRTLEPELESDAAARAQP